MTTIQTEYIRVLVAALKSRAINHPAGISCCCCCNIRTLRDVRRCHWDTCRSVSSSPGKQKHQSNCQLDYNALVTFVIILPDILLLQYKAVLSEIPERTVQFEQFRKLIEELKNSHSNIPRVDCRHEWTVNFIYWTRILKSFPSNMAAQY